MRQALKGMVSVLAAMLTFASFAGVVAAEDFGNWGRYCGDGRACFWSPSGSYYNSADTRDSYFPNNLTYASGTNMNDNVRWSYNDMNSTNECVYPSANYVIGNGGTKYCTGTNSWINGGNPLSTGPDGVSSWKSS